MLCACPYESWQTSSLDEEPVKVSHNVAGRMNHYEPFYISSDEIPAHEERFVGYGFTRSSQVSFQNRDDKLCKLSLLYVLTLKKCATEHEIDKELRISACDFYSYSDIVLTHPIYLDYLGTHSTLVRVSASQ